MKKPRSAKARRHSPKQSSTPRTFSRFTDPAEIFEHIENESIGTSDTDLYRSRIERLMTEAIEAIPNPDAQQDMAAIRGLFHGHVFEDVARKTGFVLGFEYCRELLTSDARKGGAR